jgi:hypothetical protein
MDRRGETWLIYVDDSGDEDHDLLSALCIPSHSWSTYLRRWKKVRRRIENRMGLPAAAEFHSSEFLRRRDIEGTHPETGAPYSVPFEVKRGEKVYTRPVEFEAALKTISSMDKALVFTCYRPGPNGSGDLYRHLLSWLDAYLSECNAHGIVWFDGTGIGLTAERKALHRELILESRRILEDAVPTSSEDSHLVQMADAIAHAALQSLRGTSPPHPVRRAYSALNTILVPGGLDGDGFAVRDHPQGFRVLPK